MSRTAINTHDFLALDLEVGRHDNRIHAFGAVRSQSGKARTFHGGDLDTTPPSLTPYADTTQVLAAASIVLNTRRAYPAALGRLDTWCAEMGLPLSDLALAEYLSGVVRGRESAGGGRLGGAAVKFRAKLTGMAAPVGPATARVPAVASLFSVPILTSDEMKGGVRP